MIPQEIKRTALPGNLSSLFCLFVFTFILASCTHKTTTQSGQEGQGLDLIDSLFMKAIINNEIPTAAVYIAHDGKPVYNKGFGMKDIESRTLLKASDIFRIASMTKVVTSLGIMQLVEGELLSLDDPVSKYLPEFADPQVLIEVFPDSSFSSRPADKEITIHHLLTHTSGIGYGFQSEIYNGLVIKLGISEGFEERPIVLRDNTRQIAKLPLLHDPGEKYTYGLSLDVLGSVIEAVSGERLDHYFQNNIFKPLELNNTFFYLPEREFSRLVTVYEYNTDHTGFIPTTYPFTQYPVQGAKSYLSGGADLCSTASDIGIFAQMLLNKGIYNGKRILGEQYVEMMTSKQSDHGWWNSDVGFGVSITTSRGASKGTMSIGSYNWGGFFDTYCWVDPQKDLIAVLLLQMYPTNEYKIHERFQDITYEIIDDLQ